MNLNDNRNDTRTAFSNQNQIHLSALLVGFDVYYRSHLVCLVFRSIILMTIFIDCQITMCVLLENAHFCCVNTFSSPACRLSLLHAHKVTFNCQIHEVQLPQLDLSYKISTVWLRHKNNKIMFRKTLVTFGCVSGNDWRCRVSGANATFSLSFCLNIT